MAVAPLSRFPSKAEHDPDGHRGRRAAKVSGWGGSEGCAASPGRSDGSRKRSSSAPLPPGQHSGSSESISEWFPAIVPILFCLNFSFKTISLVIVLRFRKLALPETQKTSLLFGTVSLLLTVSSLEPRFCLGLLQRLRPDSDLLFAVSVSSTLPPPRAGQKRFGFSNQLRLLESHRHFMVVGRPSSAPLSVYGTRVLLRGLWGCLSLSPGMKILLPCGFPGRRVMQQRAIP